MTARDGHDGEALSALHALGSAIAMAARTLSAIEDDATAYECSRALDKAFADLTALLEAVPGIIGLGDPGRVVSDRLERRRAELAERRADIAAYRLRLDELAGNERDLEEITAEADWLRARVEELERASRMAAEIPDLRTRAETLERAVAAADVADAPDVIARISAAAREFAALTERQREAIGVETGRLAAEAEATTREMAELRDRAAEAATEMARREDEAERLQAEHGRALPVLSAWHQADADLADGMRGAGLDPASGPLRTVLDELADVGERLTRLDDALRPLLAEHARAYEEARHLRPL